MDPLTQKLLELGIAGCFIVYLIYVCRKKDERYDALAKLVNDLQERRVNERAENAKVMTEVARSLQSLGESVEQSVSRLSDSVAVAVAAISATTRKVGRGR